ncbi:hypothetical protein T484DRAFT_1779894, partial [Baffinella frigidus]
MVVEASVLPRENVTLASGFGLDGARVDRALDSLDVWNQMKVDDLLSYSLSDLQAVMAAEAVELDTTYLSDILLSGELCDSHSTIGQCVTSSSGECAGNFTISASSTSFPCACCHMLWLLEKSKTRVGSINKDILATQTLLTEYQTNLTRVADRSDPTSPAGAMLRLRLDLNSSLQIPCTGPHSLASSYFIFHRAACERLAGDHETLWGCAVILALATHLLAIMVSFGRARFPGRKGPSSRASPPASPRGEQGPAAEDQGAGGVAGERKAPRPMPEEPAHLAVSASPGDASLLSAGVSPSPLGPSATLRRQSELSSSGVDVRPTGLANVHLEAGAREEQLAAEVEAVVEGIEGYREVSLSDRSEWASRSFEGPIEASRSFEEHGGWGTEAFQPPPAPRERGQHWAEMLSAVGAPRAAGDTAPLAHDAQAQLRPVSGSFHGSETSAHRGEARAREMFGAPPMLAPEMEAEARPVTMAESPR